MIKKIHSLILLFLFFSVYGTNNEGEKREEDPHRRKDAWLTFTPVSPPAAAARAEAAATGSDPKPIEDEDKKSPSRCSSGSVESRNLNVRVLNLTEPPANTSPRANPLPGSQGGIEWSEDPTDPFSSSTDDPASLNTGDDKAWIGGSLDLDFAKQLSASGALDSSLLPGSTDNTPRQMGRGCSHTDAGVPRDVNQKREQNRASPWGGRNRSRTLGAADTVVPLNTGDSGSSGSVHNLHITSSTSQLDISTATVEEKKAAHQTSQDSLLRRVRKVAIAPYPGTKKNKVRQRSVSGPPSMPSPAPSSHGSSEDIVAASQDTNIKEAVSNPNLHTAAPTLLVFSASAGGARGAFIAEFVRLFQERYGIHLVRRAKVAAGTSAGALFVTQSLLKKGNLFVSPQTVVNTFIDNTKRIFHRPWYSGVRRLWGVRDAAYSRKGLNEVLEEMIDKKPDGTELWFSDFPEDRTVLIPTTDPDHVTDDGEIEEEALFLLSSRQARTDPTKNVRIKDGLKATTAAPPFFKPLILQTQSGKDHFLEDGGVGWPNPIELAYLEVVNHPELYGDAKNAIYVSIGTGRKQPSPRRIQVKNESNKPQGTEKYVGLKENESDTESAKSYKTPGGGVFARDRGMRAVLTNQVGIANKHAFNAVARHVNKGHAFEFNPILPSELMYMNLTKEGDLQALKRIAAQMFVDRKEDLDKLAALIRQIPEANLPVDYKGDEYSVPSL